MAELRQHGLHTINTARLPDMAEYYTDGSADPRTGKAGAAFVCVARDASETPIPTTTTTLAIRTTNFSSSTQMELAAIHMANNKQTPHTIYNALIHRLYDCHTLLESTKQTSNTHCTQRNPCNSNQKTECHSQLDSLSWWH